MLTVVTHRDDGTLLTSSISRQAYTQVLLASIFISGYAVCDPVAPLILTMAQDTYQCLDMPANGNPPDGGVDIYDYIHFLRVRTPGSGVGATDIASADVKLDKAPCSAGGTRRRRVLLGEHPAADWTVLASICANNVQTCHYTCVATTACHFSMLPVLDAAVATGNYYSIAAPSSGFKGWAEPPRPTYQSQSSV